MESPWSTPTQSEIGDAEATLNAKSRLMLDGLDSNIRELGDGEPGLDLTPGEEFSPYHMGKFWENFGRFFDRFFGVIF